MPQPPKPSSAEPGSNRAQAETRISNRAQRKLDAEKAQRQRVLMIAGVLVLLVVFIGLAALLRSQANSATAAAIKDAPTLAADIPVDGRTMGSPDAKVKLDEWGDNSCPGCGIFARTYQPQLIADYVQTGKVQFTFHDYAFLGPESTLAAQSAYCAEQQGQFWNFHNMLYANQIGENQGSFTADRLKQMAQKVGLDMDKYEACVASDAPAKAVEDSLNQGKTLGVDSTPSFFINGQRVDWNGWDDLKAALDKALAAAK